MYSLIVDLLLAVLLVVTIGYAIVLNKRLGTLRRDKALLEKLSVSFGDSTVRAEESIEKLMTTSDFLQDRMEKAQALRDDLAFLIDRGGQAADNLEDLVRESRGMVGVGPKALKGQGREPVTEPEPDPQPVKEEAKAEAKPLRADPKEAPVDQAPAAKTEDGEFHSEAEQELLRAIRSAG